MTIYMNIYDICAHRYEHLLRTPLRPPSGTPITKNREELNAAVANCSNERVKVFVKKVFAKVCVKVSVEVSVEVFVRVAENYF